MLEAESEAEDKSSRPRPRTKFWPRGQLGLEDLTSLFDSKRICWYFVSIHLCRCALWLKVGSNCRSDQLDQARSSDREPVWQVVGMVGINRASCMIIFDHQKVSNREAKRPRSDRVLVELIGKWSCRDLLWSG